MSGCELCETVGGELVWQDELCRVVRVGGAEGADYPGFCRVIWRKHVREMSDLTGGERRHLMALTFAVEVALRELYRPDKINLASLGNVTPHLHWHVIPRWADDRNFPAPIWATLQATQAQTQTQSQRSAAPAASRPDVSLQALHDRLVGALAEGQGGSF